MRPLSQRGKLLGMPLLYCDRHYARSSISLARAVEIEARLLLQRELAPTLQRSTVGIDKCLGEIHATVGIVLGYKDLGHY